MTEKISLARRLTSRQYPQHGTGEVMEERLRGRTDTDYFYFLCPRCGQIIQVELLQSVDHGAGVTHHFGCYCTQCHFLSRFKIPQGEDGWEGGTLQDEPEE